MRIDMIGIITGQFSEMLEFYRDVMGFEVKMQVENNYVEFENEGVRFALSTKKVMADATGEQGYLEENKGHPLELAFRVNSPEEVDTKYNELVEKGAQPVTDPADQPWNQRTAFFADPDGNIHEIFADL